MCVCVCVCAAQSYGGAIYASGGGTLTVEHSWFVGNTAAAVSHMGACVSGGRGASGYIFLLSPVFFASIIAAMLVLGLLILGCLRGLRGCVVGGEPEEERAAAGGRRRDAGG